MNLHFVIVILSLLCLFLAAIGVPSSKISLGWLGMFFWLLSEVFK